MTDSLTDLQESLFEWVYDHSHTAQLGHVALSEFSEAHGLDSQATRILLVQCIDRGFFVPSQAAWDGSSARLTASGWKWVKQRKERRGNRVLRNAAARDGLLRWLWECKQDGIDMPLVEDVLKDPLSLFEGERLAKDEIRRAAASLKERGLIAGGEVAQIVGPVRAETTDRGDRCVEQHGGDVNEYERQGLSSGPTFNIGGDNKGNIAASSQHVEMKATTVEADKATEVLTLLEQYRQALPVLDLPEEVGNELAELVDELERDVGELAPDLGRVRTRLQRMGAALNSPLISGTLASLIATGALDLAASLH